MTTLDTIKLLRHALAASQAREQELRVALKANIEHHPDPREAYRILKLADAALARPSDTSALREFGLKVARAMYVCPGQEPLQKRDEAIVDAMLEGK